MSALKDQLTAGGTAAVGAIGAEQVDLYRSQVEGLRAEMGAVTDSVSVLSSRIDEVAATADRSIEVAQQRVDEVQAEAQAAMNAAEVEAEAAAISSALAAGQPYAEPVAKLSAYPDIAMPKRLPRLPKPVRPRWRCCATASDAAYSGIRASIMASPATA